MVYCKIGTYYYGERWDVEPQTGSEDILNIVNLEFDDTVPKLFTYSSNFIGDYGSDFRWYKQNGSSWQEVSDDTIGLTRIIIQGGKEALIATYSRYHVTFSGEPRSTGTYMLAVLHNGTLYGQVVNVVSSLPQEAVRYIEYSYNPSKSFFVQKDLAVYGLPLNIEWSNFKSGIKNNQLIVGKVTNNQFYKCNNITATGAYAGTYQYLLTPYPLVTDVSSTTDTVFTANFSTTPETFTLTYTTYSSEYVSQETSQTFTSGQSFTLPSPGTRGEHYTFGHWLVAGRQLQPGQSITVLNTDLEIVPVWVGKTYTVSFNLDGSTSPSYIAPMQKQYPGTITLPSVTKSNYYLSGWDDGTTVHIPGSSYKPTSDITLNPVFVANQYTVRFYDVGQSTPMSVQTVTYPATVNVPTATLQSGITYRGWKNKQTDAIVINAGSTTYQPTSDIDLERVYEYSLSLAIVNSNGTETQPYRRTNIPYPDVCVLPQKNGSVAYDDSFTPPGYVLQGWGTARTVPNPNNAYSGQYTFTPTYTVVDNVVVLQAIPTLYSQFTPKELSGFTVNPTIISITKEQATDVTATVTPSDWVGEIEWSISATGGTASAYLSITTLNNRAVRISGLNANGPDGVSLKLIATGKVRTWDEQSQEITIQIPVDVYAYNSIYFFTRDENGKEQPYNNNTISGSPSNAFFVSTETEQWVQVGSKTYPDDPQRYGFTFLGWADGDGNLVDMQHPPENPTDCYATWTYEYVDEERDSAYLQLFNFDNTRLLKQIDLGVIQTNTESFSTGISSNATPTMTSENTFITNLACTESIRVEIIRTSPITFNDESDNPHDWSNCKWIEEMRALVDRWQSSTDGIKFLFIPRNLTISEVVGQLAGYGDNYDLLGYAKEYDSENSENNLGLLFRQGNETYVLYGYNGIIDSFSDTYSAQNQTVISVSFTITLGGMKSRYQNWKDALVLLK